MRKIFQVIGASTVTWHESEPKWDTSVNDPESVDGICPPLNPNVIPCLGPRARPTHSACDSALPSRVGLACSSARPSLVRGFFSPFFSRSSPHFIFALGPSVALGSGQADPAEVFHPPTFFRGSEVASSVASGMKAEEQPGRFYTSKHYQMGNMAEMATLYTIHFVVRYYLRED